MRGSDDRRKSDAYTRQVCERAVENVQHRFEAQRAFDFLGRTGEAVCVVDDRQRIALWNAGASKLLGLWPGEVLGRRCYDVVGFDDVSGCRFCCKRCPVQRAARRGKIVATREMHVMTRRRGRLAVDVATVVFPSLWLAHLFHPRQANPR
jgi:PAS domain-containing protein